MDIAYMPMPTNHPTNRSPVGITAVGRAMTRHEKLVEQTRKWVATSFFEPMLKQMRQSPFHSNLLDGGEGGQAFESMYDERLAERMATSSTDPLVNSIVRKIEGAQAYARQWANAKKSAIDSEREGADRVREISATGNGSIGDSHVSSRF
jgi:Rod binding domain-containing protein